MPTTDRPFARHEAHTRFLYVPAVDWNRVAVGEKTEFRTRPRGGSRLLGCYLPTPVVLYSNARGALREVPSKLMVLEDRRYEPLFNVADDAEALRREGFVDYATFRRYWRARSKGRYTPMQMVWVWRVRPFGDNDLVDEGVRLLRALYGEHLPQESI